MRGLFSYDNPLITILNKIINCIFLSLVWVVFSLPVFTIGASTTALYYTVQKNIKNERGYVWADFWQSFKTNFKQSTLIWLVMLAAAAVFVLDISILKFFGRQGNSAGQFAFIFYILLFLEALYAYFIFSYIARFEIHTKAVLKNCVFLMIAHLPKTLGAAALLFLAGFLVWLIPVLIFLIPSLFTWLISAVLESIYRKYMTEEDKQKEDLRNNDFTKG